MGNEDIGWCSRHEETNDPCYGCERERQGRGRENDDKIRAAAEAKGYAKALEEALKCFDPLIREGDAERLYEVTYRRIQALKEKVKP
jgi:hypothetical protein